MNTQINVSKELYPFEGNYLKLGEHLPGEEVADRRVEGRPARKSALASPCISVEAGFEMQCTI